VSERLGVHFAGKARSDGKREVREVVGVPEALNRAFSRRRAAIVQRHTALIAEYRQKHGRSPSAAVQVELAQVATLQTREAKGLHQPLSELVPQWRATADRVLGPGGFEESMAAAAARTVVSDERSLERVADDALAVVSGQHSTFNRWHIRAEVERQLRGYPTTADRTALVDHVESLIVGPGGSAIRLTVDVDDVVAEQLRGNGESIYRVHGQDRFTARSVLDAEARLVAAGFAVSPYRAQVPGDLLVDLDGGQRALVQHFANAGTVLAVSVGAAGVGKTTAMRALARAWEMGGGRVVAMANAATAADKLGNEIGIRAQTIARVVTLHEHGLACDEDSCRILSAVGH